MKETLDLYAFFVKRAVIINNIGFETGYSFKIVSQQNIAVLKSRLSLRTLQSM